MMIRDSPSETVSKLPVKHFLFIRVALVIESPWSNRTVTQTVCATYMGNLEGQRRLVDFLDSVWLVVVSYSTWALWNSSRYSLSAKPSFQPQEKMYFPARVI